MLFHVPCSDLPLNLQSEVKIINNLEGSWYRNFDSNNEFCNSKGIKNLIKSHYHRRHSERNMLYICHIRAPINVSHHQTLLLWQQLFCFYGLNWCHAHDFAAKSHNLHMIQTLFTFHRHAPPWAKTGTSRHLSSTSVVHFSLHSDAIFSKIRQTQMKHMLWTYMTSN